MIIWIGMTAHWYVSPIIASVLLSPLDNHPKLYNVVGSFLSRQPIHWLYCL